MDKAMLDKKILELKGWEKEVKNLQAIIDGLKDEIKFMMVSEDLTEFTTDTFTIRYKDIVSSRFDTASFKKENSDLYKKYLKESVNKRFTID